jgi:hypothetical protein
MSAAGQKSKRTGSARKQQQILRHFASQKPIRTPAPYC